MPRSHHRSGYLDQTRSCGRDMIFLGLHEGPSRSAAVCSGLPGSVAVAVSTRIILTCQKIRVALEKPDGLEAVWNASCSALVKSCILVYKVELIRKTSSHGKSTSGLHKKHNLQGGEESYCQLKSRFQGLPKIEKVVQMINNSSKIR